MPEQQTVRFIPLALLAVLLVLGGFLRFYDIQSRGPSFFDEGIYTLEGRWIVSTSISLWEAFKLEAGAAANVKTVLSEAGSLLVSGNDLADTLPYLRDPQAQAAFQNLIWGPLIASATPPNADIPNSVPEWPGLLTPVNVPTTFSFMQIIEDDFWLGLTQKAQLKKLFGDADDPISYYLWFGFP